MQPTSPLISVLINNYNYAPFIKESVESVLAQTYQNFEIIIVDDGSTDNSAEIIESFRDTRITKIFKANGGQASAFNAGFEVSRGDLITFLDSDDWWKPHRLEEVVRWHNFLHGDYALLQHNVDIWDNGKTYPFKPAMYSGNCFRHTIRTGELGLFVGTSGLTFTREILEKVMPVPTELRISADAYLTRTSFTFGFVYSIPQTLGYYRKHNNAVLGNSTYNHEKFHKKTLFPHLNRFYDSMNIDFQYKTTDQICPTQNIAYPEYVFYLLMRKKFESILALYPRIAIFGEGQHSEWLSNTLKGTINQHVSAIIEVDPIGKDMYFGQYATEANQLDVNKIDAIVLSTISMQDVLKERCRTIFGSDIVLIDLYSELITWT